MLKRALDEDDCIDGGSDDAAAAACVLPTSVMMNSGASELDVLRGRTKDDLDEDADADRHSECSAVMESSASDDTSLLTDGSTDAADPCSTSMSYHTDTLSILLNIFCCHTTLLVPQCLTPLFAHHNGSFSWFTYMM